MRLGAAALAIGLLGGCPADAIPYVTIQGSVTPPRAPVPVQIVGARIDVVAIKGNLGKTGVTTVGASTEISGTYTVQLDASTVPSSPALFKILVMNPDRPPRDGPLLAAIVVLNRPPGKGPNLGTMTANLDATSSLAALGISYRAGLQPDLDASAINPLKVAQHLNKNPILVFGYATTYQTFVTLKSNDAPAANFDLALQASEDLPADLSKVD